MHTPIRLRFLACLTVAALLAACVQDPAQVDACTDGGCKAQPYAIGPGDVLHISVWKDASLDRTVTVRPDGMISFPLLNDIDAAGLTPQALQQAVSDKLKQFMAEPEVSVVVQEVHSYAVSVLGQVKTPGRYEFKTEGASVLDVLAQAGGLTAFASPSDIVVLRTVNGVRKRLSFDYDDAVAGKSGDQVFFVHPGDVILVP